MYSSFTFSGQKEEKNNYVQQMSPHKENAKIKENERVAIVEVHTASYTQAFTTISVWGVDST